jgi:hypothetical protein
MRKPTLKPAEAARAKDEWLRTVDELEQQVREWAEAQGWTVEQSEREVNDAYIGTYKVPVLEITTPQGEVVLEPAGTDVLRAQGRVDLYAWPSHYRVLLFRETDRQNWLVWTESGLTWPHPWGPSTFVELAEGLAKAG